MEVAAVNDEIEQVEKLSEIIRLDGKRYDVSAEK